MRALFLSLVFLLGCFPLKISGSNVPTDNTSGLTPEAISAAEDDLESCRLDWVGDDAQEVVDKALAELESGGVSVIERRKLGFTTAHRRRLYVSNGFWEKPVKHQAIILTHELVHYCQRDEEGDSAFERAYASSVGRWRIEVPAEAQSLRTVAALGASQSRLMSYIDDCLGTMRDFYWLHDLDPAQYDLETRRLWGSVLDE